VMIEWQGKRPSVAEGAFVAPNAVLVGDVSVETGASIWFGAVLRGDFGAIVVRRGANVQDNAVVHVDAEHPTTIGERMPPSATERYWRRAPSGAERSWA